MMDSGLLVLIVYLISLAYCLVITFMNSASKWKNPSYGSFLGISAIALLPIINTLVMLSGVSLWIAESKLMRSKVFWRKRK